MNVCDIMKKDVVTIKKDAPVSAAMKLMIKHDIGSLLVKEGGEYGIITRKDIVNKVIAYEGDLTKVKVVEVFTEPILTVSPDISVKEVARLMAKSNVRRFPVVDKGELVGIISNSDVLKSFIK
ncbi:MAG: CBS domain-containing protein [Candidatus Altiarchaeota archaeon]|nr:CBS domain-containing protein [Candidatus Altiarchaeota archaeon]